MMNKGKPHHSFVYTLYCRSIKITSITDKNEVTEKLWKEDFLMYVYM
jgi:hypothetical protein